MAALSTCLRSETAWLEAQQAFPFKPQPMIIFGYDVDCGDVLDLTDGGTLARDGIDAGELSCAWVDLATRGLVPPSWALARRLVGEGVAAIIVPSFAAGAGVANVNVVFWDWSREPPHRVRVIDDEGRLPRDGGSWG